MARCNCSGDTCRCVLQEGTNVTITGAGTPRDPWVVSAAGGEGGGESGWFPGDLKDTAAADTPAGWLECAGQAVSRDTYAALFAAIGGLWGIGDGSTTFNVPDFRGQFRLGVGNLGGGLVYATGDSGGQRTRTLDVDNLPVHAHTMAHTHSIAHDHPGFDTANSGGHTHAGDLKIATAGLGANEAANNNASVSRGSAAGADTTAPLTWTSGGQHTHTINVPSYAGNSGASSTANTGSVGAATPFSILPPYKAVRVLIKT